MESLNSFTFSVRTVNSSLKLNKRVSSESIRVGNVDLSVFNAPRVIVVVGPNIYVVVITDDGGCTFNDKGAIVGVVGIL